MNGLTFEGMTTFQTVVYAIVHGASEFLPIGSRAHHILFAFLLGWQPPSGALLSAFLIGSCLALFVYYRHDWASMISSLLQVIIYRRRPMTLDERIPLFIGVTSIPLVIASFYYHSPTPDADWNPLNVAGILAVSTLPLWFFDYWNRKFKGMCDWNWADAFVVGLVQATALFPGWEGLSAILAGALFINYKREPALKYAYFAYFPILFTRMILSLKDVDFHGATPMADLSWLSFAVAILVTWFVGFLVIGGFLKQMQQKGIGQYMVYRLFLALLVCGFYWLKSH